MLPICGTDAVVYGPDLPACLRKEFLYEAPPPEEAV